MIVYWWRSLTLSLSRELGAVADHLRRPVLIHLMIIAAIAASLTFAGWLSGFTVADLRARAAAVALGPKPVAEAAGSTQPPAAGMARTGGARRADVRVTRWLTLSNVLSIWAFGLVVWSILRARRQLVIARFEDFAGEKAGFNVTGFGVLIATQLSALNDLFREFEKGRAIQATPEHFTPLNATFQAVGTGATLDQAVSSESSFGLGPLKLPVGVVASLLSKLVQGPTLSGQLHRDGNCRVLTVRLAGRLGNRSWRMVEHATVDEAGEQHWRPAADLADDVAYRVFTELTIGPTVRWEALASFASGVRAYRRSLSLNRERRLNLREAERALIAAQAEDEHFDLAYYNLGVVYMELEEFDAAASAFERARKENGVRWSTQYALAVTHLQRALQAFNAEHSETALLQLSKALDHCEEARRLAPDAATVAQIFSVSCAVYWWRGWRTVPGFPRLYDLKQAGVHARRGVTKAWRALLAAELGLRTATSELRSVRERARAAAVRNFTDLSALQLVYAQLVDAQAALGRTSHQMRFIRWSVLRGATGCLRLAAELAPSNAGIYVELGKAYRLRGHWKPAARALRSATRLDPDAPEAWAALALMLARLDTRNLADEASQRLFEHAHRASAESIGMLIEANAIHRRLFDEMGAVALEKQKQRSRLQRLRLMARLMRLSWRLGERRFTDFGPASTLMLHLLKDADARAAAVAGFEKAMSRARALVALREKLPQLVKRGQDGVQELVTLLNEQRDAQRAWEFGEVGSALARVYIDLGQYSEAEKSFEQVVQLLEGTLDSEIKRRGLHAMISRLRRAQGKPQDALEEARKAITKDPLSAFERTELGLVYFELAEFTAAQEAWEEALRFEPNDPDLHVNLGRAHIQQLRDADNNATRVQRLDAARRELDIALELYERSDPRRNPARFFLASVHSFGGRWVDALRELRALERGAYCPLIVRLEIADAHLVQEDWAEAERGFREVAAQIDEQIALHDVNHVPERPPDSNHVLGTLSAFAYVGIASSLAGRDLKLAESMNEVQRARAALHGLVDAGLKATWTATCDYFEGYIFLKQDQVEAAIDKMQQALAVTVHPQTYLFLAEALARRVELAGNGIDHSPIIRRAKGYAAEAERLDWTRQLQKELPRVNARLGALAER